MKQKKISTENRTIDGLYKGTLFVRTVHNYNQLIWSVSIIAIAVTMLCSFRNDNGYLTLTTAGCVLILFIALSCITAICISCYHKKRLQIAQDLIALRKGMREYGFGDSDCLFYKQPTSKEDWVTILRDSFEYANTYKYFDDNFLDAAATFAQRMLSRQYLM